MRLMADLPSREQLAHRGFSREHFILRTRHPSQEGNWPSPLLFLASPSPDSISSVSCIRARDAPCGWQMG